MDDKYSRSFTMAAAEKKKVNHSRAYIVQKVGLKSDHAQKIYERSYKSASDSLYVLDVVFRIVSKSNPALIQEVQDMVDNMLTDMRKEIHNEIERLTVLCDDNGIIIDLQYTLEKNKEARVDSPRGGIFLGMIEDSDELFGLLDSLWLSQVINGNERSSSSFMWQRRLVSLAARIRGLSSSAVAKAKKSDDKVMRDEVTKSVNESGIDLDAPVSMDTDD